MSRVINYSLYEFRGKESLNRIELSRLVQDLLNFFWAPCGSGEGQVGGGCLEASGGKESVPTHMHIHAHAHV